MRSPYSDLPPDAYWRTGVAARAPLDPGEVFVPRFAVSRDMNVVTGGSCFAQVVGRALREAGFAVIDAEPLSEAVPDDVARRFGYRIFSARYGNIYTARQLAQLFDEAEGAATPALPVWRRDGRFFDAQRPNVEPDGLETEADVLRHRTAHLAAVRSAFRQADLFVFTFGLTEAWVHAATGTVYPTAPGTIAGDFDPAMFVLRNFDAIEVLADFERFRAQLKAVNPTVRFLVTTSPVPMTATASGAHIEVANCYSKSTLRAVCGMLAARHEDIDYFPGYEIITSQNARGAYYGPNQRNISPAGVKAAMSAFLAAHGIGAAAPEPSARVKRSKPDRARLANKAGSRRAAQADAEVECEEALLEAFAR